MVFVVFGVCVGILVNKQQCENFVSYDEYICFMLEDINEKWVIFKKGIFSEVKL